MRFEYRQFSVWYWGAEIYSKHYRPQIINIVKYRIITYSYNLISCNVFPISWLPSIAQRTACTQNVPIDTTFHLNTSSPLCNIGEPRWRQNNTKYWILKIGSPSREWLNVGTVPTFKIRNVGTVPNFKMHNVGTVPTFKMHNIGTQIFL